LVVATVSAAKAIAHLVAATATATPTTIRPTRGCETDFLADPKSCGSCGNICGVAGGVAECSNGTCAIKSCTAPMADCTGGYKDGCETNLNTDIANCDACTTRAPRRWYAAVRGSEMSGQVVQRTEHGLQRDGRGRLRDQHLEQLEPLRQLHWARHELHDGLRQRYRALREQRVRVRRLRHRPSGLPTRWLSNGCEVNYKTDTNHCGSCGTSALRPTLRARLAMEARACPFATAGHARLWQPPKWLRHQHGHRRGQLRRLQQRVQYGRGSARFREYLQR